MENHNLDNLLSDCKDSFDAISDHYSKIKKMMNEYLILYFVPLIPGIMITNYYDLGKGTEFILMPGKKLIHRKYKAIIKIHYTGSVDLLFTMPEEDTNDLITIESKCKNVYFAPHSSSSTKDQEKAFERQLQEIESFLREAIEEIG